MAGDYPFGRPSKKDPLSKYKTLVFSDLTENEKWEVTFELLQLVFSYIQNSNKDSEVHSTHYITIWNIYQSFQYRELARSEVYENFVDILSNIVQSHSLHREYVGIEDFDLANFKRFGLNDKDELEKISDYWNKYHKPIYIPTLDLIYDNFDFIDLVAKNKIEFTTLLEPKTAPKICKLIHYMSENYQQIKFGNPNIGEQISNESDKFSLKMGPILDSLTEDGYKSVRSKADELNKRGIPTLRNKKWTHDTVQKTLKRWQSLKAEEENEASPSPKGKAPKPE